MNKPDVHTFHDYREYLKESVKYLKSERSFSQKKIAETCEVSVALLSMVLNGQRVPSKKLLNNLATVLRLTTSEKNFLLHLKVLSDSDSLSERNDAVKKMTGFKRYRGSSDEEVVIYSYLSKWYNVAIRELVATTFFINDTNWIFDKLQFKVSKKRIRESIKFLLENDFIGSDEQGNLFQKEKSLFCTKEIHRLGLIESHKQMFDLAIKSIDKVSREERYIVGKTLPVSKEQYQKIIEILNESLDKIENINNQKETSTEVYQISLAAFPLTVRKKEK